MMMMNRTHAPTGKYSKKQSRGGNFSMATPTTTKPFSKPITKAGKNLEIPEVNWDKILASKKKPLSVTTDPLVKPVKVTSPRSHSSRHQVETLEPAKRSISSKRSSFKQKSSGSNETLTGLDKFKRPVRIANEEAPKKTFARRDEFKMPRQRLNKLIATVTTHSRRKVDELIQQGKVKVNGQVVRELGTVVEEPHKAKVEVAGVAVRLQVRMKTIVMNKPKDCLTTRKDPQGRRTVYDLLPKEYHDLIPVGRLDRNSTGLLIMTNDGDLVQQLTHPKYHLPKVYRVTLDRAVEDEERLANRFIEGIWFEEEAQFAKAVELIMVSPTEWGIVLESGMNRQVRRMFAACSYDVVSLKRIAIGDFQASGLMSGKFKELRYNDVQQLRRMLKRHEQQLKKDATLDALNTQILAAASELGI